MAYPLIIRPQLKVKPRHTWQRDEKVTYCTGCKRGFTFLLRKHHCRFCGKIFCDNCTIKRHEGNRICRGCLNPQLVRSPSPPPINRKEQLWIDLQTVNNILTPGDVQTWLTEISEETYNNAQIAYAIEMLATETTFAAELKKNIWRTVLAKACIQLANNGDEKFCEPHNIQLLQQSIFHAVASLTIIRNPNKELADLLNALKEKILRGDISSPVSSPYSAQHRS